MTVYVIFDGGTESNCDSCGFESGEVVAVYASRADAEAEEEPPNAIRLVRTGSSREGSVVNIKWFVIGYLCGAAVALFAMVIR